MSNDDHQPHPPVLVVMGVSGCGKSTVAGIVAGRLGWDLEEGDDLHPKANVAKMTAGTSLIDDDRWPWLERVADWIRAHTDSGRPGVITCSALRRSYRDRLRGEHVIFVHLHGSYEMVNRRLTARTDHFMPAGLLRSQFAALEPLDVVELVGEAAQVTGAVAVGVGERPHEYLVEHRALEPGVVDVQRSSVAEVVGRGLDQLVVGRRLSAVLVDGTMLRGRGGGLGGHGRIALLPGEIQTEDENAPNQSYLGTGRHARLGSMTRAA